MSVECKANPRRIQGESKANPRRNPGERKEIRGRFPGTETRRSQVEDKKKTRRVGHYREQGQEQAATSTTWFLQKRSAATDGESSKYNSRPAPLAPPFVKAAPSKSQEKRKHHFVTTRDEGYRMINTACSGAFPSHKVHQLAIRTFSKCCLSSADSSVWFQSTSCFRSSPPTTNNLANEPPAIGLSIEP